MAEFDAQFRMQPRDYVAGLDFYTWTRHFHVLHDLLAREQGDVLEVGTGDGVVRRCAGPFMRSYRVMDINPALQPDIVGNLLDPQPALAASADAVVCAEVLEHLPFEALPRALAQLQGFVRPGGRLYLTLPHRKSHMLFVTPRQRLWPLRFPVGLLSLSEAWNRFVRRRIWIDPHHCWEIGDGRVRRRDVERLLADGGWQVQAFRALPYCDCWILAHGQPPTA